jgi:hypothetical protein
MRPLGRFIQVVGAVIDAFDRPPDHACGGVKPGFSHGAERQAFRLMAKWLNAE